MLRIEGDGSYQNTRVWRDDTMVVGWESLTIHINKDNCQATLNSFAADATPEDIKRIIISGLFMLVSEGAFVNSKLLYDDSPVHGVQELLITIAKNQHPRIFINAVLLPNLVEG